jgi:hypothetical protein
MKRFGMLSLTIALVSITGQVATISKAQSLGIRGVVHVESFQKDLPLQEAQWAGTKGRSLRLEGFAVNPSPPIPGLGLEYMCHLQGTGDTHYWMPAGSFCGTRGESRRLEGLAIRLTGTDSARYDIYYGCHLEGRGDTGPVSNGGFCGTRGESRRLEALAIWIFPKGSPPPHEIPNISLFDASPNNGFISVGGTATLSWMVEWCGTDCVVSLEGREGLGNVVLFMPRVGASGSQQVSPHFTSTYTLRATNSDGTATREKQVKLHGAGPTCVTYYFKMTNPASRVTPCFTTAICAPDQETAKRIAEYSNGGYTATRIDASQFNTACQ